MAVDPNKVFYPEASGMTRQKIANIMLHYTGAGIIPNFGQEGLGLNALIEVMSDEMVQEFVDELGKMQSQQHDYRSPKDYKLLYEYQWAKFAEQLVGEVHEQGGPG